MADLKSFFVATGSNLGDRSANLLAAKIILIGHFQFIAESRIYESPAVDYLNQPDFYNQVLEFKIPQQAPEEVMQFLLRIEKEMGRNREIPKGPRIIDLDILFWGTTCIQSEFLTIPHPRLFERSFVVLPIAELPGFSELKKVFSFKFEFDNNATPLSSLT